LRVEQHDGAGLQREFIGQDGDHVIADGGQVEGSGETSGQALDYA
jgi:hypothetical protein